VPSSSATLLVTTYAYTYYAAGLYVETHDPMGIDTHSNYDNLGRLARIIQNYTGQAETTESDVSTNYYYDGNNNLTYVDANQPGGAYEQTRYVYGVTTASGSGVNSNDILSAIQHPDPSTGHPSSSQQDRYLANALGQVVQSTDRNGNVHQYSYDVLGRLTSDAVTTLGTGVDGTIRRIQYAYDSQGNLSLITSYNAASGGSIVNQVQRVFNGLGQLTGEYQSHSGAVVQGTTPEVQYVYTEMSGGQNNSRLTSMTYPSGYVLNFNYNTGLDSNISRLSSISDSGGTLESYKYLGLDTVVERDHPQNNVNLTYISQNGQTGDAGDQYTGLDRFGRVVDQNWYNTTTQTSTDNLQYGYDQDSDVLYRQNLVDAVMSELYTYDNLHQLASFQRGTLNSTKTGISGTPSRSQSWTPDALGNFTGVTTNSTTQTRAANQQNEYTSISGSGTITYDANGNITADGSGNTYVYDAWNRLVAVKNGSTTLAAYGYDGLDRRITETHGSTTTDLYYSANWQVLEERSNGQLQARYVWSPAGIDTLVLREDSSQNNGVLDRRLYVQQDMVGNVTALVDTSGNVVERYDYDPFGAVTVLNPDFSSRGNSSYNWNNYFQGKRYDATMGLYDSRGRVYSPSLMRPLQADPLGLGPDDNDYRWEGNEPTDGIDPSGMAPPFGGISGGVGGMGGYQPPAVPPRWYPNGGVAGGWPGGSPNSLPPTMGGYGAYGGVPGQRYQPYQPPPYTPPNSGGTGGSPGSGLGGGGLGAALPPFPPGSGGVPKTPKDRPTPLPRNLPPNKLPRPARPGRPGVGGYDPKFYGPGKTPPPPTKKIPKSLPPLPKPPTSPPPPFFIIFFKNIIDMYFWDPRNKECPPT